MSILKQLLKKNIIDKNLFSDLLSKKNSQKKTEEEIILEEEIISEDNLLEIKSELLKVPVKKEIPDKISPDVLKLIPENSAISYKMIPLKKEGNIVEVGMINPEDIKSKETLRFISRQGKFNFKIFLIKPKDFKELIKQYKTLERQTEQAWEEFKKTKEDAYLIEELEEKDRTAAMAEDAPIIKMVSVIIKHAVEGRASDIHIEPIEEKLKVRYRLDGILYTSLFLPLRVHRAVIARIKILSKMKIDETRVPQDGRFTMIINKKEVDFRVSSFPTINGEKIAIRVLDPIEGMKDYRELGFGKRNTKLVKKSSENPYGLILSTGPTGSGKTTTLYALLHLLNKEQVNIVTIEDPIEYSIKGVNQSQVNNDIKYTFAKGLRNILRQDPDVIMVGEIRDEETANLVIHAALTGHIVLSTLHTNNAAGVIPRLLDMKIKSFLIPSTLNIIIAQRLVRSLCPKCRKKIEPNQEVRKYILERINSFSLEAQGEINTDELFIYKPQGCEECNFKGYTGRVGLFEVLEMTDKLADFLLEKNISRKKIIEEAKSQGMITLEQDGIIKALKGITTIEEVVRVSKGG